MEFLAVWRDISLLWLLFLTLIAVLPIGVVLFFCIKGMHRLRRLSKKYLTIARDTAQRVAGGTEQASQKVASPLIAAQVAGARISAIARTTMTRRKQP
ncbi:MAG: hypothetical protein JXM73_00155 [Anaerolineae bacterium]|nr:hypothetical protein [Anaerolineae bacterium]